jgi:hypothetical protein
VARDIKVCDNCGKTLAERVEEEVRTGTSGDSSTGLCVTYRVWFCMNPECVMHNADVYKEPIADAR